MKRSSVFAVVVLCGFSAAMFAQSESKIYCSVSNELPMMYPISFLAWAAMAPQLDGLKAGYPRAGSAGSEVWGIQKGIPFSEADPIPTTGGVSLENAKFSGTASSNTFDKQSLIFSCVCDSSTAYVGGIHAK